ncbi:MULTISPECIES: hypothetical protein [Cyanophyceae]|nr:hypothetical protein [Trichocoleus sp. FACHB-40]
MLRFFVVQKLARDDNYAIAISTKHQTIAPKLYGAATAQTVV